MSHKSSCFWTRIALALALTPGIAWAQQPGEPEDNYVFEDEVFVSETASEIPTSNTVAAKLPLSLQETPASVSVVGAPLFEEQGAFILGDALRNVSGANVQSGSGVYDFFVVRGLDSISSGLILSDGAPEPETTFYQLYNVERVEVLRGPSSFLYGGSPLGATVNLVRKQPVGDNFLRLGGLFGSYETFEGTLDANRTNSSGTMSFRVNSLWQESANYRDDKDSSNLAINPALSWRPSDRTFLNVNFEYVDTEYKSDSGLPIHSLTGEVPDVPRTRSYQSPFDISDQQILRFQVDFESHISSNFVVRNKTYYRELEWDSKGTIFNGVAPLGPVGSDIIFRSLLMLEDVQELAGNQLEALWKVETGVITHNLLAGLELSQLADEFTFDVGALPPIGLLDPVETASQPVLLIPGQSLGADARSRVTAPYVVDQITFSDKFQLLAGVRFDVIDFEDDLTGTSRDDEQLSPMVGVVLTPTPALSFYANAGEAFAPPSTLVVGQEREPEESQQIEAGVKTSSTDGRLQASLAAFRIDRENIAIPTTTGILRQTGSQRSQGAELELASVLRPGLRATFAYAYTDSELTEYAEQVFLPTPPFVLRFDYSGNTAPFAPEHLANLWITQRFGNGFGLGLGGRYVSEQFIAASNVFTIDDYATLDAALFYALGRWDLQVNLKNLTDKEYLTRGFGETSVIPAPGFNAQAGFHYTF
jgi:catecholate siderophore receptor